MFLLFPGLGRKATMAVRSFSPGINQIHFFSAVQLFCTIACNKVADVVLHTVGWIADFKHFHYLWACIKQSGYDKLFHTVLILYCIWRRRESHPLCLISFQDTITWRSSKNLWFIRCVHTLSFSGQANLSLIQFWCIVQLHDPTL